MSLQNTVFEKIFANTFVYSILFEDSDVDCRYLDLSENGRILTIAGAGCGAAALSCFHPQSMDIVDNNLAHLSLTALKTLAPRYLSYAEFFQLLVIGKTPQAQELVARVMLDSQVPEPIRRYQHRFHRIFRRGLYRSGLTNRMTQGLTFANKVNPDWIIEVAHLPIEERIKRVQQDVLATLDLPGIRHLASSPLLLLSLGINFRQKAKIERTEGMSFFKHLKRYLQDMSRTDMMRNWFIWVALVGRLNYADELAMPPYLRREMYAQSRQSRAAIRLHHENISAVMQAREDHYWTYINCSDVLDWMDTASQQTFLNLVYAKASPGARVLIRSVEPLDLIEHFSLQNKFQRICDISDNAAQEDRTMLYKSVNFYDVQK